MRSRVIGAALGAMFAAAGNIPLAAAESLDFEVETFCDPIHLVGPDGEFRILLKTPFDFGETEEVDCLRPLALPREEARLVEAALTIEFSRTGAHDDLRIEALPVIRNWDSRSEEQAFAGAESGEIEWEPPIWDFPWSTPGGDVVIPTRDAHIAEIRRGARRKKAEIDLRNAIAEAWEVCDSIRREKAEAGEVLYAGELGTGVFGFILTAPLDEDTLGFTRGEIGALGKIVKVKLELEFEVPEAPPAPYGIGASPVYWEDSGGASGEIRSRRSEERVKAGSVQTGKPTGPPVKPPVDPPPPPPPPPPPIRRVERVEPPPPPPPPPPPIRHADDSRVTPPPAPPEERKDAPDPSKEAPGEPEKKPAREPKKPEGGAAAPEASAP